MKLFALTLHNEYMGTKASSIQVLHTSATSILHLMGLMTTGAYMQTAACLPRTIACPAMPAPCGGVQEPLPPPSSLRGRP